jgi:hypothetical protein
LRDRISALELKLAELTGAIDILRATTPPPARDTRALGELLSPNTYRRVALTEHRKFVDHPLTGIELRALFSSRQTTDSPWTRTSATAADPGTLVSTA